MFAMQFSHAVDEDRTFRSLSDPICLTPYGVQANAALCLLALVSLLSLCLFDGIVSVLVRDYILTWQGLLQYLAGITRVLDGDY